MTAYDLAKQEYAVQGIDCEAALKALSDIHRTVHCWHCDDVIGLVRGG